MVLIPEILMRAAQLGILTLEQADQQLPEKLDWQTRLRVDAIRVQHPTLDRVTLQTNLITRIVDVRLTPSIGDREQLMVMLLPHVEAEILPQALQAIFTASQRMRYLLFHLLRPRLTHPLWDQIVELLNHPAQDYETRLETSAFIRPYLPERLATSLAPILPPRARGMPDAKSAEAFRSLINAPEDPNDYSGKREKSLIGLIPSLIPEQQAHLLVFVRSLNGRRKYTRQIELITSLFPYLDAQRKQDALDFVLEQMPLRDNEARRLDDGGWDFYQLVRVVANDLSAADQQRLLEIIYLITGAYSRIRALLALVAVPPARPSGLALRPRLGLWSRRCVQGCLMWMMSAIRLASSAILFKSCRSNTCPKPPKLPRNSKATARNPLPSATSRCG